MSVKINHHNHERFRVGGIGAVIRKDLEDYSEEVAKCVIATVKQNAEEAVWMLQLESPNRTGEYASSWRVTTREDLPVHKRRYFGRFQKVIHNKHCYRLTHLLEHGHDIKNSDGKVIGRAEELPHIQRVAEKIAKKYEKELIEAIEMETRKKQN